MHAKILNRPATLLALLALLVVLGIGGLYGGAALLMEPSGAVLGVDRSLLESVPIGDFLLPGLFLLIVMGLLPLLAAYGAWTLADWSWLQRVNPWRDFHWSWGLARVIAVLLILLIGLEFLMWGNASPLQPIMLAIGLAILVLCGYPSIRRYLWMGNIDAAGAGPDVVTEHTDGTEQG